MNQEESVSSQKNFDGENQEKIKYLDTFAIPTVSEMFGILPMFSGSPHKIAEIISEALKKPKNFRTKEEQDKIDELVNSVFKTEEKIEYFDGKEEKIETGYLLIADNQMISATAEAPNTFLKNKEGLITYIKKTYGPEGLRHFLAILIALEEFGRKGLCKITINEHLERLGYTKKSSGTYDIDLKKIATQIIFILSSLYITIIKKKSKDDIKIKAVKLFHLERIDMSSIGQFLVGEKFYILASNWYNEAFLSDKSQTPKYNKILKSVSHENHLHHSITLYLSTILSLFWRMNPNFEITVSKLMDWCDLDRESRNKRYYLKNLEKELNYMKEKNYIGNWCIKNTDSLLSDLINPFDAVLIIEPPVWLDSLKNTEEKRKKYVLLEDCENISVEDFNIYFKNSKLSIKDFCEKIDISPRMFHLIRTGERNVSENVSRRVLLAGF